MPTISAVEAELRAAVILGCGDLCWKMAFSGEYDDYAGRLREIVEHGYRVIKWAEAEGIDTGPLIAFVDEASVCCREGRKDALHLWENARPVVRRIQLKALGIMGTAQADGANDPTAADAAGKPGKKRKRMEWLVDAMLLVNRNPEWSDAKIAGEVHRDKSQLARSRVYKAAAAQARKQGPTRGGTVAIDSDTRSRTIEAIDDREESQDEIDDRIDRESPKTQRNPQRKIDKTAIK